MEKEMSLAANIRIWWSFKNKYRRLLLMLSFYYLRYKNPVFIFAPLPITKMVKNHYAGVPPLKYTTLLTRF